MFKYGSSIIWLGLCETVAHLVNKDYYNSIVAYTKDRNNIIMRYFCGTTDNYDDLLADLPEDLKALYKDKPSFIKVRGSYLYKIKKNEDIAAQQAVTNYINIYNAEDNISFVDIYLYLHITIGIEHEVLCNAVNSLIDAMVEYGSPEYAMFTLLQDYILVDQLKSEKFGELSESDMRAYCSHVIAASDGDLGLSYNAASGFTIIGLMKTNLKSMLGNIQQEDDKSKLKVLSYMGTSLVKNDFKRTSEYQMGKDGKAFRQKTVNLNEEDITYNEPLGPAFNESRAVDYLLNINDADKEMKLHLVDIFLNNDPLAYLNNFLEMSIQKNGNKTQRLYGIVLRAITIAKIEFDKPEYKGEKTDAAFRMKVISLLNTNNRVKNPHNYNYVDFFHRTDELDTNKFMRMNQHYIWVQNLRDAEVDRATGTYLAKSSGSEKVQNVCYFKCSATVRDEILAAAGTNQVYFTQEGLDVLDRTIRAYLKLYNVLGHALQDGCNLQGLSKLGNSWKPVENEVRSDFTVNDFLTRAKVPFLSELAERSNKQEQLYNLQKGLVKESFRKNAGAYAIDRWLIENNLFGVLTSTSSLPVFEKQEDDLMQKNTYRSGAIKDGYVYDLTTEKIISFVLNIIFTKVFSSNFDKSQNYMPYGYSNAPIDTVVFEDADGIKHFKPGINFKMSDSDFTSLLMSGLINWNNKCALDCFALLIQVMQDEILPECTRVPNTQYLVDEKVSSFISLVTTFCIRMIESSKSITSLNKFSFRDEMIQIQEVDNTGEPINWYYYDVKFSKLFYSLFALRKPLAKNNPCHIRQTLQTYMRDMSNNSEYLFDEARKRLDALDPDYILRNEDYNIQTAQCKVKNPENKLTAYNGNTKEFQKFQVAFSDWRVNKDGEPPQKSLNTLRIIACNWDSLDCSVAFSAFDGKGDVGPTEANDIYTVGYTEDVMSAWLSKDTLYPETPQGETVNYKVGRDYPFAVFATQYDSKDIWGNKSDFVSLYPEYSYVKDSNTVSIMEIKNVNSKLEYEEGKEDTYYYTIYPAYVYYENGEEFYREYLIHDVNKNNSEIVYPHKSEYVSETNAGEESSNLIYEKAFNNDKRVVTHIVGYDDITGSGVQTFETKSSWKRTCDTLWKNACEGRWNNSVGNAARNYPMTAYPDSSGEIIYEPHAFSNLQVVDGRPYLSELGMLYGFYESEITYANDSIMFVHSADKRSMVGQYLHNTVATVSEKYSREFVKFGERHPRLPEFLNNHFEYKKLIHTNSEKALITGLSKSSVSSIAGMSLTVNENTEAGRRYIQDRNAERQEQLKLTGSISDLNTVLNAERDSSIQQIGTNADRVQLLETGVSDAMARLSGTIGESANNENYGLIEVDENDNNHGITLVDSGKQSLQEFTSMQSRSNITFETINNKLTTIKPEHYIGSAYVTNLANIRNRAFEQAEFPEISEENFPLTSDPVTTVISGGEYSCKNEIHNILETSRKLKAHICSLNCFFDPRLPDDSISVRPELLFGTFSQATVNIKHIYNTLPIYHKKEVIEDYVREVNKSARRFDYIEGYAGDKTLYGKSVKDSYRRYAPINDKILNSYHKKYIQSEASQETCELINTISGTFQTHYHRVAQNNYRMVICLEDFLNLFCDLFAISKYLKTTSDNTSFCDRYTLPSENYMEHYYKDNSSMRNLIPFQEMNFIASLSSRPVKPQKENELYNNSQNSFTTNYFALSEDECFFNNERSIETLASLQGVRTNNTSKSRLRTMQRSVITESYADYYSVFDSIARKIDDLNAEIIGRFTERSAGLNIIYNKSTYLLNRTPLISRNINSGNNVSIKLVNLLINYLAKDNPSEGTSKLIQMQQFMINPLKDKSLSSSPGFSISDKYNMQLLCYNIASKNNVVFVKYDELDLQRGEDTFEAFKEKCYFLMSKSGVIFSIITTDTTLTEIKNLISIPYNTQLYNNILARIKEKLNNS